MPFDPDDFLRVHGPSEGVRATRAQPQHWNQYADALAQAATTDDLDGVSVAAGDRGQTFRSKGGPEPEWDDDLAVRSDDYASIAAAAAAAGWNTSDGGSVVRTPKGLRIPEGDHALTAPVAVYDTWEANIRGEKGAVLAPGATGMAALLRMDDCAYSLVERLVFASGTANTVDDVVRIDGPSSAQGVRVRDLHVDGFAWARAISIGLYSSGNDLANVEVSGMTVTGSWASGNTTTYQQGITLGDSNFGNVLNLDVSDSSVSGVRYPLVVNATNATFRNVHVDTGEVAIKGLGWGYLLWDGFRVEDCERFADFGSFSTGSTNKTFRNGWYSHNLTVTSQACNFERAGDVLFENIMWIAGNYPTTKAQIRVNGSGVGQKVTFRNFSARESPAEITETVGTLWQNCWVIFDGYTQVDADLQPIASLRGLYTRTVTAATNIQPYDGNLIANTTGGAFAVNLPLAKWMGGREIVIKQVSGNAATITPTSPDTVNGTTTLVPGSGVTKRLVSDGVSDWMVVG